MVQEEVIFGNRVPQSLQSRLQTNLGPVPNTDWEEYGRAVGWAEGIVPRPAKSFGEGGCWVVEGNGLAWEGDLSSHLRGEGDPCVLGEVEPHRELLDGVRVRRRCVRRPDKSLSALFLLVCIELLLPLSELVLRGVDHIPLAVSVLNWNLTLSRLLCEQPVPCGSE